MHRRARHLNPGSAGASLALDSRFITGLSDGDPVSTWADRTANGNNATQTLTLRPTYQTNAVNGNASVEFDGVNDYLNSNANIFATGAGSDYWLFVTKPNDASWSPLIQGGSTVTGQSRFIFTRSTSDNIFTGFYIYDKSNWPTYGSGVKVLSSTFDGTSQELRLAGVSLGTFTPTAVNTVRLISRIGGYLDVSGFNQYFQGEMLNVTTIQGSPTLSLRRRLEHAVAFSFKISCS